MKRILFAVAFVTFIAAVALLAQTPAPKPGPEQQKLDVWSGSWTMQGEANPDYSRITLKTPATPP